MSEETKLAKSQLQNVNGDQTSPIDAKALNRIFGDDRDSRLAILKKFATQTVKIVDKCEAAYQRCDADKVAFETHKLKSSARTVGADHLADVCFALELAGKRQIGLK